ncbi:MAG: hypothetical protein MI921_06535 [Cytophagales bacterium]|nr:hypothetical protein [Cytophagales bacterium]
MKNELLITNALYAGYFIVTLYDNLPTDGNLLKSSVPEHQKVGIIGRNSDPIDFYRLTSIIK